MFIEPFQGGLGGHFLYPKGLVEISLGHGGVGFVGAGRGDALVLEVDFDRAVEGLSKPSAR